MAEPGRAVVPRDHRQGHPPRRVPSVPDLIAAIEAYLEANNADPTPLVWTATAESILAKVRRARLKLEAIAS